MRKYTHVPPWGLSEMGWNVTACMCVCVLINLCVHTHQYMRAPAHVLCLIKPEVPLSSNHYTGDSIT